MLAEADRRQAEDGVKKRGGSARLMGLLPNAAVLATFDWYFVDKNREARTVFGSARDLVTVTATLLGYVVLALLVRRLTRWAWVGAHCAQCSR